MAESKYARQLEEFGFKAYGEIVIGIKNNSGKPNEEVAEMLVNQFQSLQSRLRGRLPYGNLDGKTIVTDECGKNWYRDGSVDLSKHPWLVAAKSLLSPEETKKMS